VEPEELWEDADNDNQSNDGSHASAPDHHEVESSSSFDYPDLEIDHDHTDSSLETLQELGKKFLLKIKHKNSLTEKTMHNIAFCTSELISATVMRLKNELKRCLDSADVDINEIEGLGEVFAESDDLCKATKTFCCTSGDENWKRSAGYVVSEKFILH